MEDIELINFEMDPFASIINNEEFYFQKGSNALKEWLDYSIDYNAQKRFYNIIKDYNTFKNLKPNNEFFELKELFFEIISYCDLHASDKEKYNKYLDKRVLAKAGVRMSPWVTHLYNYRYHPENTNITVKNALDLLNEPINNINSISVTHRQLISKYYLGSDYNELTFVDCLKKHFTKIPTPKVADNSTVLIARILYNQKEKWNPKPEKFKDFTAAFKKYLVEESLPFQVVKEDKNWFWIADFEGNFDSEEMHYELIINKGTIEIDLHFEKSVKTSKCYQSLIGTLPDFLRWKKWGEWGKCVSHKESVSIDDVDAIENAINYLNELYDYTVEFYKKEKQAMIKKAKLLRHKKQIILQGPPGTGKTRDAKLIAKEITKTNAVENKSLAIKTLTKNFIKSKLFVSQKIKGKNNKEFEVVGLEKNIVLLKSETSKPWRPSYNKIIESFNNKSWELKNRTGGFKPYEDVIAKYFYENHIDSIDSKEEKIFREQDFINLIQFHPSYTYEDFVRGIVAKPNEESDGIIYEAENKTLAKFAEVANDDQDNNYVLIIDEINRANLSSVLGELIYALEYRGEAVESIYDGDGENQLILPTNLYIIGTMNTADRSVGHIDYAIRRRFAFVDVLPKDLSSGSDVTFMKKEFETVTSLFVKNYDSKIDYNENPSKIERSEHLMKDFDPKDVWLGHSYFIQQFEKDEQGKNIEDEAIDFDLRIKYEIKPILEEYIKDGILKESARQIVNSL